MAKDNMEDFKKKYEDIVDRIKTMANDPEQPYVIIRALEEQFPKIVESDDEKVRKTLIGIFTYYNEKSHFFNSEVTKSKVLAWLEKRGQTFTKKDVDDAYLKGICDAKQELQKQDEQKPADKVIEEEKPLLEKFKQLVYDCAWGKVTCKVEGETKEEYANRWANQFLIMVRDWADDYIDYITQRKLRKSYDKGKEDAIKENIPAWSEKDEEMLEDVRSNFEFNREKMSDGLIEQYNHFFDKIKYLQSQLQQEWSEEDESMLNFVKVVLSKHQNDEFFDKSETTLNDCLSWFKDIKSRVGCEADCTTTKDWSEEDEDMCYKAIAVINRLCAEGKDYVWSIKTLKKLFYWLKSLRLQKRWKPTRTQTDSLGAVIKHPDRMTEYNKKELTELLEQLKKLQKTTRQ